jgi:hypothetical protein
VRPERGRLAFLIVSFALGSVFDASAQIYTRKNRDGVVEATNVPDGSDFRLTYPGKGTLIHSRGFSRRYFGQYDDHIRSAGSFHGVSEELIKAVIQVESEFDQWAVSSKGAQGLMQLMPFTAQRFGVSDPFDARQNIFGGVQYLRLLMDLFTGDVPLVLAAYNAGENAVLRYKGIPPYRETRGYVQKIQALLAGGPGALSASAMYFTPGSTPRVGSSVSNASNGSYTPRPSKSAKPAKLAPARPRVYYKWRDDSGRVHVAHTPPAEGTVFTTIRALD